MALPENELKVFMSKLYRFLEQGHKFHFDRLRMLHGKIYIDRFPTDVYLHPSGTFFTTLIHEAIHYIYPEWSESKVLKYESKVVCSLSDRQIKNIIKKFAQAL
jgi:hypothetical protein